MKMVDAVLIFAMALGAAAYVVIAAVTFVEAAHERPLPHRAVTELTNWGQGRAPAGNRCPPGTIRFETDDGLFLECYRGAE